MSEAELLYEITIGGLRFKASIKRYYHTDLFLKLSHRGNFTAFSYIKNKIFFMQLRMGLGGTAEEKEVEPGTLIYDSAEDALGIVLEKLELGKHQIQVGTVEGNIEELTKYPRAAIAKFTLL